MMAWTMLDVNTTIEPAISVEKGASKVDRGLNHPHLACLICPRKHLDALLAIPADQSPEAGYVLGLALRCVVDFCFLQLLEPRCPPVVEGWSDQDYCR